ASTRARRSTSLTWALSILTLPAWMRSLLMVGRTFSASSKGTLTRTVSPLASELMTRTCSQRSEVDEDLDEPEDDCATTPKGASNKRAVAARADLAKRLREQLDITSLRLDILRLRLDMKGC